MVVASTDTNFLPQRQWWSKHISISFNLCAIDTGFSHLPCCAQYESDQEQYFKLANNCFGLASVYFQFWARYFAVNKQDKQRLGCPDRPESSFDYLETLPSIKGFGWCVQLTKDLLECQLKKGRMPPEKPFKHGAVAILQVVIYVFMCN